MSNRIFLLLIFYLYKCIQAQAQEDLYCAPLGNMVTHPNAEVAVFGSIVNDAIGKQSTISTSQTGINHNGGGTVYLYRRNIHGVGITYIRDGFLAPTPIDNYNSGGAAVRFYNLVTDNNCANYNAPSGTLINSDFGIGNFSVEQEICVTNLHTFVNGKIWTPRSKWKHAYLHYDANTASYTGALANNTTAVDIGLKMVDGYVAKTGNSDFLFPIGDGIYTRFSGIVSPEMGTYKSAYFKKNAQSGTTGISGNNASTSPMYGGIQKVNVSEFWDIDGTAKSNFTLTALNTVSGYSDWNNSSNFSAYPPAQTIITGFDAWENLGINAAPSSHSVDGTFTTTAPTKPDNTFSAYTWASKKIITNPDFNTTWTGVPVTGNVSVNDVVPIGTTYGVPVAVSGNPSASTPTVNPDGTYTFTSTVVGIYQFLIPVCPPGQTVGCPQEVLTITVLDSLSNTNSPVANVDIATTPLNTPVTISTLANDRGGSPGLSLDSTSVNITDSPNNGTVSVDPITGDITYTPNSGFIGNDTLKYEVCDKQVPPVCSEAFQIITVLPAIMPNSTLAADDYNTTPLNTSVSGNVLENDSDPEANMQTVTPQTTTIAGKGSITIAADGSYTFTPATGYQGPVEFVYEVCDNGTPVSCAEATLHILVSSPITLPVELLNFSGKANNCKAELIWKTAEELNFSHFELEKKIGSDSYKSIARISSRGSNSTYSFTDRSSDKDVYYRLKMVDNDGSHKYSNILRFADLCSNRGTFVFNVYPNPSTSNQTINVEYNSETKAENAVITVSDLNGKFISYKQFPLEIGLNVTGLDNLNLSQGVYIISIVNNSKSIVKPIKIVITEP